MNRDIYNNCSAAVSETCDLTIASPMP